jgi:molecular chaperone DnaK (HSP70)
MTKLPINYQKACIYEIVCKDVNITQRYVGSTTNLIQRRGAHKTNCNNEKGKNYSMYVYQFIRENGGFENWDVVLIEQVIDCQDKQNLHKRERYYIESLKAELNKQIPLRTVKEYYENNKDKITENVKEYRENNRDKVAETRKKYYEKNKDKIKEYYENNKDILTKQMKEYYERKKNLN